MARNLTVLAATALEGVVVTPLIMVQITFSNEIVYCHSGVGNIVYSGHTYTGVGSLGQISVISENSDQTASGITLELSGIPTELLNDCLNFANGTGFASVSLGFVLATGALVASPFILFSGIVDAPEIMMSVESVTISLAIESRMSDLNRARGMRLTNAGQRELYPNDSCLQWTPYVMDLFLNWKSAK